MEPVNIDLPKPVRSIQLTAVHAERQVRARIAKPEAELALCRRKYAPASGRLRIHGRANGAAAAPTG
jgi:hypothetical protein